MSRTATATTAIPEPERSDEWRRRPERRDSPQLRAARRLRSRARRNSPARDRRPRRGRRQLHAAGHRNQRSFEVAGRGLLWFGWFPPAWLTGTAALSLSKILDNMEIGHNVMHGQFDWTNDPKLSSKGCPSGHGLPRNISGATPTTTCTTPTRTSWARTGTSATASCACPRIRSGGRTTWAIRSTRRCSRPSSSTGSPCTMSSSSA